MNGLSISVKTHGAVPVPLQKQGPQLGIIVPGLTELVYALIVAEPTTAPVSEGVDRRKQPCVLANVIKLVDAVQ